MVNKSYIFKTFTAIFHNEVHSNLEELRERYKDVDVQGITYNTTEKHFFVICKCEKWPEGLRKDW